MIARWEGAVLFGITLVWTSVCAMKLEQIHHHTRWMARLGHEGDPAKVANNEGCAGWEALADTA